MKCFLRHTSLSQEGQTLGMDGSIGGHSTVAQPVSKPREVELLGHRASPWLQGTVTQHPQQWPRGGVAGTNLGLSWDLYDAQVASPHHRIH